MMQADGQVALVTGASSGIGRAIAAALAAAGMHVVLVARDSVRLAEASRFVRGSRPSLAADLTEDSGRAAAAALTAARLDVLVHSAGVYARAAGSALNAGQWQDLDAINLHAPILLTASCLPQLRAACGQVVFINSSAALSASAGLAGYAAGKRGLHAAADILRQEVNGDGIRVLSVFPGRTDTPMQTAILEAERRMAPPGSLMRPEDVATMVVAALGLPRSAEVTDIMMRPMRRL